MTRSAVRQAHVRSCPTWLKKAKAAGLMCVIFCLTSGWGVGVGSQASAATLTVGVVEADVGGTGVAVPISLETEAFEDVTDMQFDLLYDADHLELADMEAGPATEEADKDFDFSELDEPGQVRAVVSGLNVNPIPDGVVVTAYFDVTDQVPEETLSLSLENAILSDAVGVQVPTSTEDGGIAIEDVPFGDVTGSGTVNAMDIQTVINYVLGIPIDPSYEPDVTGTGTVNAADIQAVINVVLGIE